MNPIAVLISRIIRYKAVTKINYNSFFFIIGSILFFILGIAGYNNAEEADIKLFGLIFFCFLSFTSLLIGIDLYRNKMTLAESIAKSSDLHQAVKDDWFIRQPILTYIFIFDIIFFPILIILNYWIEQSFPLNNIQQVRLILAGIVVLVIIMEMILMIIIGVLKIQLKRWNTKEAKKNV